jgi:hypothetical protein
MSRRSNSGNEKVRMMRPGVSLLFLLFLVAHVRASDAGVSDEIWRHPEKAGAVAAAQLVAVRHPLTVAAMRIEGFDRDLWDELPLWVDRVPPLNRSRLAVVKDDVSFANFADLAPEEMPREAMAEDLVFWQAVAYSTVVPKELFARAARASSHLTFGHLYTEPTKYRGVVVHFEGRLKRLKRLDPPLHAQRKGVGVLYEGWIFLDEPGTHPVCVIVAHLPANLAVGAQIGQRVAFDGYFFKRYRYISGRLDADKNNVALNTLALIGPSLTVLERPGPAGGGGVISSTVPWTWILSFVGGVAVVVLVMSWWFKHNDRQVRKRLQANRLAWEVQTLEQLPNAHTRRGYRGLASE